MTWQTYLVIVFMGSVLAFWLIIIDRKKERRSRIRRLTMEEEMLEPALVEAYERHALACPEKFPVDVPREVLLHLFKVYKRHLSECLKEEKVVAQ